MSMFSSSVFTFLFLSIFFFVISHLNYLCASLFHLFIIFLTSVFILVFYLTFLYFYSPFIPPLHILPLAFLSFFFNLSFFYLSFPTSLFLLHFHLSSFSFFPIANFILLHTFEPSVYLSVSHISRHFPSPFSSHSELHFSFHFSCFSFVVPFPPSYCSASSFPGECVTERVDQSVQGSLVWAPLWTHLRIESGVHPLRQHPLTFPSQVLSWDLYKWYSLCPGGWMLDRIDWRGDVAFNLFFRLYVFLPLSFIFFFMCSLLLWLFFSLYVCLWIGRRAVVSLSQFFCPCAFLCLFVRKNVCL